MSFNDESHYTRWVTLPSGRKIEVVYFKQPLATQAIGAATPDASDPVRGMHICPRCDCDFVYLVEWEETTVTHTWEVWLRCPNCEWHNYDVPTEQRLFDQATVDRFDEQLDLDTETLTQDLHQLVQQNMEDETRRFATALHDDHILPEDF